MNSSLLDHLDDLQSVLSEIALRVIYGGSTTSNTGAHGSSAQGRTNAADIACLVLMAAKAQDLSAPEITLESYRGPGSWLMRQGRPSFPVYLKYATCSNLAVAMVQKEPRGNFESATVDEINNKRREWEATQGVTQSFKAGTQDRNPTEDWNVDILGRQGSIWTAIDKRPPPQGTETEGSQMSPT